MIPSEMLTQVRSQLFETEDGFYSDSYLYNLMNQAEVQLAKVAEITSGVSGIPTVIGQREYAIPSGAIYVNRVAWDNCPLIKIDRNDVDLKEGTAYGKVDASGSPMYYYEEPAAIGLSPVPDAVKTLTVEYDFLPIAVSDDSDSFTIPDKYVYYIQNYVLYMAFLKDDDARYRVFLDLWLKNLSDIREDVRKTKTRNKVSIVRDSNYDFSLRPFIRY